MEPAKRSGAAVSEKPGSAAGQRAGQQAGDAVLSNRDDKMVDGEAVSPGADPVLERALAKISRRVIPLFMATVFMNYLDRSKWVDACCQTLVLRGWRMGQPSVFCRTCTGAAAAGRRLCSCSGCAGPVTLGARRIPTAAGPSSPTAACRTQRWC
jgi:hypothetical protein